MARQKKERLPATMSQSARAALDGRRRQQQQAAPSLVSQTAADVGIALDYLYLDDGADVFVARHHMTWRPGTVHLTFLDVVAPMAQKDNYWPFPIHYWQRGLTIHVPPVMATPDGCPFDAWRFAHREIVYLKWANKGFVAALLQRFHHRYALVPSHPNAEGDLRRVLGAPARFVPVFERAAIVMLLEFLHVGGGDFQKYMASPCWDWPHPAPRPPDSVLRDLASYQFCGCSTVVFAGPPVGPLASGGEPGPMLEDELIRDWPRYEKICRSRV